MKDRQHKVPAIQRSMGRKVEIVHAGAPQKPPIDKGPEAKPQVGRKSDDLNKMILALIRNPDKVAVEKALLKKVCVRKCNFLGPVTKPCTSTYVA